MCHCILENGFWKLFGSFTLVNCCFILQFLFDFIDIGRGVKPGTYRLVIFLPSLTLIDICLVNTFTEYSKHGAIYTCCKWCWQSRSALYRVLVMILQCQCLQPVVWLNNLFRDLQRLTIAYISCLLSAAPGFIKLKAFLVWHDNVVKQIPWDTQQNDWDENNIQSPPKES